MYEELIEQIFASSTLQERPPVLLDIGASGAIHAQWSSFAKHSIAIAFDADDREMGYVEKTDGGFRKLYVINRIVTERKQGRMPFVLTKSPYCSSLLEPDLDSLRHWSFVDYFLPERRTELETTDLPTVLRDLGLDRVDWFKTDSQGTDLRLFRSLGDALCRSVAVAEFEPGIIDAYRGEDKLYAVLAHMDGLPFWVSRLTVRGAERINPEIARSVFSPHELRHLRYGDSVLLTSPGWAEITYTNTFEWLGHADKRAALLGVTFALVQRQLGFALDLALRAKNLFADPVFAAAAEYCVVEIRGQIRERHEQTAARAGSSLKQRVKRALIRRLERL